MSAANWRRAMSAPAASVPAQTPTAAPSQPIPLRRRRRGSLLRWVRASIRPRHVIVLIALLVYPAVATPFFTFQIGALLIGLAEQFGLAYAPTYGIVFTFVIMVAVLAFRPQGIMGRTA